MDIKINGKLTVVSDENEELLNELATRIINEDVHGATGEADFDIHSSKWLSIDGILEIQYEYDNDGDYPEIDGQIEAMEL